MAETFTWFPDVGSTQTVEPRVLLAPYGDGYEQRVQDGINHIKEVWELSFTCGPAVSLEILDFLRARGGWQSFNWTSPDGLVGLWVCRKWTHNRKVGEGIRQISATFEKVA